jgi:hypothetical protein
MRKMLFCLVFSFLSAGCLTHAQMNGNNTNNMRGNMNGGNVPCDPTVFGTNCYKPMNISSEKPSGKNPASQTKLYEVCGIPDVQCLSAKEFDPQNLPFRVTGNLEMWGEYKSKPFYAIILKSKKAFWDESPMVEGECEKGFFTEEERLQGQKLFPQNKVFASDLGCYASNQLYYTNSNKDFNFLAVYAGNNITEANSFLKQVKSVGKFPGANIRRMQVILCYGCH